MARPATHRPTEAMAVPVPATHRPTEAMAVPVPPTDSASTDQLDDEARRILKALDGQKPQHLDQIAVKAKVSAATALAKLLDLEIKGLCAQQPGKYFLRR